MWELNLLGDLKPVIVDGLRISEAPDFALPAERTEPFDIVSYSSGSPTDEAREDVGESDDGQKWALNAVLAGMPRKSKI